MEKIARSVRRFVRKYRLRGRRVTAERLKEILSRMGFLVLYFSPEDAGCRRLFEDLEISYYPYVADAFTYVSRNNRLVFLRTYLSEEEECLLLSHEIGHIFLGHPSGRGILENGDVQKEADAHAFARILLKGKGYRRKELLINLFVCFLAVLLTSTAFCANGAYLTRMLSQRMETQSAAGALCETGGIPADTPVAVASGNAVYHLPGCACLEEGTLVTYTLLDKAEKQGYTPCSHCIPF